MMMSAIALISCSSGRDLPDGSYTVAEPVSRVEERYQPVESIFSAGDELELTVWRQDDLSQSLTVNTVGNIHIPLAGTIHAAGMTVQELREEITLRLSKYLKDPVVNVLAIKLLKQSFYIFGEVATVGKHDLVGRLSVFEAVMTAEGLTEDADDRILLIRKETNAIRIIGVNMSLADIEKGGFNAHQFFLAQGDIIYVPPSRISDIEKFASSMSTILSPILDIERMFILWPSLVDALSSSSNSTDVRVAF